MRLNKFELTIVASALREYAEKTAKIQTSAPKNLSNHIKQLNTNTKLTAYRLADLLNYHNDNNYVVLTEKD